MSESSYTYNMKVLKFTLVSGNKDKLSEWKRLLPDSVIVDNAEIDLDEIQSLDLRKIVERKAADAYNIIKKPVVVEDVSLGLDSLSGLPGPFIKFFNERMGAEGLYMLTHGKEDDAIVSCCVTYYDGKNFTTIQADVRGRVVASRGAGGFGYDEVFMPEGSIKTYAQMTHDEKDSVSHRSKAVKLLMEALSK